MFERLHEQGDLLAANQSGVQFIQEEHSSRSSSLLPHSVAQIDQAHEAVTLAGSNLQIPELLDDLDGALRKLPSFSKKKTPIVEHYQWVPHPPALADFSANLAPLSSTSEPEIRAVDFWTIKKLGGDAVKPFAILIYQRMSDYEIEPVHTAVAPLKFRAKMPDEQYPKQFDLERLFLEESALCHAFNERDLSSKLADKTTKELAHLAEDLHFFYNRAAPDLYWEQGNMDLASFQVRKGKWDGQDTAHMRRFYSERIKDYRKEFSAYKVKLKANWIDPDLLTPGIYESHKELPRINSLFHSSAPLPGKRPWQKDTFVPGGVLAEVARDTQANICMPLDTHLYRERLAEQLETHIYHPNKSFMKYYPS